MRFSGKIKGLFGVALAASLVASCATTGDINSAAEALKLDESVSDLVDEKTSDDISIFSDLGGDGAVDAGAKSVGAMDDQPFYSAVGGETLGRVAYALYSDRRVAPRLAAKNPEITASATLTPGQQVYFDFNGLRPQPTYLTKDLLERYPNQLAQALVAGDQYTVSVQVGETLQTISQRLYGTTRYWTEIYLLNKDKLAGFDKVSAGIEIAVVKRKAAGITYAEATVEPQTRTEAAPEVLEERLTADVLGADQPPQEERAPVLAPPPAVPPVERVAPAPPVVKAPEAPPQQQAESFWSSTNIRRIIYVGLILVIVLFAFYVTRPSKKQKFDMLDMTSSHMDGGNRPKLSRENNDRNIVG